MSNFENRNSFKMQEIEAELAAISIMTDLRQEILLTFDALPWWAILRQNKTLNASRILGRAIRKQLALCSMHLTELENYKHYNYD